ncbi:hypothetical protein BUALT_Bualt08G0040900 [Buddleja alternifolia]|uniref:Retrotransposon gag domain-containing protein n=1 Tax=Buddleja alternifolia TaxID=168488 RepID=A0AAV6X559_9LAMI|nr:hypothetical protein BUALT_Bualt08G0040900 [Buddleja alternifolia]
MLNILKDFEKFEANSPPRPQISRKHPSNHVSSQSDNQSSNCGTPDSTGFSQFSIDLSDDDDNVGGSSSQRPIGVKKAKLKKKVEEERSKDVDKLKAQNEEVVELMRKPTEDRKHHFEMREKELYLKEQEMLLRAQEVQMHQQQRQMHQQQRVDYCTNSQVYLYSNFPGIGTTMVETTRSNTELRKDVDALKETCEQTEKTIEDMRNMLAKLIMNQQPLPPPVNGGLLFFGDVGESLGTRAPHSWASGYQIPTKLWRVEFLYFNGDDLRGWLYKCEQFFEVDDTSPTTKVKLAVVHLEGRALQWHQMFMKGRLTREVPNWEEYIQALNDRTLVYDDPMSELVNLKQVGNFQHYLDKFDEVVNCLELLD